ncbi:hypothetical protein PIB30_067288 [Stylosanthes scabra]|uniref:Uncharacterized protein n=1 Tax=Stylosanthes scabra TaxID=79078 RepID=A0ABU6RMT1_9FABA|nr:hypothetical protein [Stylosanthes scabra]
MVSSLWGTTFASKQRAAERIVPEVELEGDPKEPYLAGNAYVYVSDASYSSEQESTSVGSGPSSRHSSDSSTGSGSIGYGEASSGSASDCASDDDLRNGKGIPLHEFKLHPLHFGTIFPCKVKISWVPVQSDQSVSDRFTGLSSVFKKMVICHESDRDYDRFDQFNWPIRCDFENYVVGN